MKIWQRLFLGFSNIVLLVAVIGYLSLNASQKTLQKSIGENSVALSTDMLEHIDRTIYNRIETFQEYSEDLLMQKVILESNQKFEKLDNTHAYINEKDHQWTSVPKEEVTSFMQGLIDNELSEELRGKIDFYEKKYGYKIFGEIFITNKYGANAAQTGKTTDYYQADERWWQKAKEYGLYVADIEYDKSADVYSTDIAIKIDDEDGNFSGIIKVILNVEEIINLVRKEEEERKTTEFKLLTKDRRVIYSTEEFKFLKKLPEELFPCSPEDRSEYIPYFIAKGDKPGEGEKLFAHAHSKGYKDFKGLDWILVVEHETKEIFVPVARLRNLLLVILLILIISAVLIGLFISYSISTPLGKLKKAIAKIGAGKLDTKIEIESNDEVGQVAASFKKMIKDLRKTTTSITNLNREITERKQAQEELEKYREHLEELVKERTTQLETTNKQLEEGITKRKMAEEEKKKLEAQLQQIHKMEAIGTLAGGIAHDFNNILAALIGYADLAKDDIPEGTVTHQNIEGVLIAADRAKDLVKQILTFSRRNESELAPIQIGPTVKEALRMLRASLPTTIEIHQHIKCNDFTIMGNETQIHQVLINLCTNAAYAMRENGGVLDVSGTHVDIALDVVTQFGDLRRGSYLKLVVKDTGCGMSSEVIERIFEPFFTTKEVDEGTGMGLSVVHGIVQNHGGTITVDSKPGEGTTFNIFFPCVEDREMIETEDSEVAFGQGEQILFVDDEKVLVDITTKMLQRIGYEVIGKNDSIEALEVFQEDPAKFDLVITDQTMPKMTGTELAKKILNIRPDIPIILCTGSSESIDSERAKDIGIREFVMKPISRGKLSLIICEILDKKEITV